ncbi:Cyclin-dependent kinase inhibitor 6 [Capsicum chinense]|uniref:Cyclin-dependent kinase inhibitor n=1 Tax=Capsicum annuum TaxID=4072 RepID=A0A1U8DZL8_CAPAN|nr:cyclin-dependent kinase inhibitor 7 [Capsicum annuum]KAF3666275.1 Cyclin-dependent kinase inhibitor 6 [Capsicum annuum]PHT63101.1 Cyclin-dependent kinase inhibitor 6 [Capsicum annuum]PHT97425.1 Cyclin-dependent kinase inhibitor 6 [Capsicum chinense]
MKASMGEYLKKCEKFSEMKVEEIENGGLITRGNDDEVEVTSTLSSSTKKRKVDFSENSASPATSVTSVDIPANSQFSSCYESGEVIMMKKNILKSLDLKAEEFETDNSASFNGGFSENFKQIDQQNLTSEHTGDSEEMESSSTTTKKSSSSGSDDPRKLPSAAKFPPEAEIEEFFAEAEKREQKRFAEKYNYDIVKDAPLEGRYQWVILKP